MRTHSKVLFVGLLSLALISGAGVYYKYNHPNRIHHIQNNISKNLQLSDDQNSALKKFTQSLVDSKRTFYQKRLFELDQLLGLLEEEQLDRDQAMEIIRDRLANIESQAEKMIASASDFTDSLSNEQRLMLKEMVEKRISKHQRHHKQRNSDHKLES